MKEKKKEKEIWGSLFHEWLQEYNPNNCDLKWDKSIILNQQSVNPLMYNWTHPHKLHVGENKEK